MLTIETDGAGIAVLILDVPDRPANLPVRALADALDEAVTALTADDGVRGVIVTTGRDSFLGGWDPLELGALGGLTAAEASDQVRQFSDVLRRLETMGKPVVAASPGAALGVGLELMLACHHRIAAAGEATVFGFPDVELGLVPRAGGSQRLPRLIGIEAALPILLNPEPMPADKAMAAGILDSLVAPDELLPAARQLLLDGGVSAAVPWDERGFCPPGLVPGTLAAFNFFTGANAALARDTCPAYPAPQAILTCVYEGMRLPFDRALTLEARQFGRLITGEVAQGLIRLRALAEARGDMSRLRPSGANAQIARTCREAMAAEAARIAGTDIPANRVNAAIRQFDIGLDPLPADVAVDAAPVTRDAMRELARQLLIAGAQAVAKEEPNDADAADLAAVGHGGFPAWTGGPLAFLEREGIRARR